VRLGLLNQDLGGLEVKHAQRQPDLNVRLRVVVLQLREGQAQQPLGHGGGVALGNGVERGGKG